MNFSAPKEEEETTIFDRKLVLYTQARCRNSGQRGTAPGEHWAPTSAYDPSWDLNLQPSSYKTSSVPLSHELQSFVIILEKMKTQKWKFLDGFFFKHPE